MSFLLYVERSNMYYHHISLVEIWKIPLNPDFLNNRCFFAFRGRLGPRDHISGGCSEGTLGEKFLLTKIQNGRQNIFFCHSFAPK